MGPEAKKLISDLINLSAKSGNFKWIALALDNSSDALIHPSEDYNSIKPFLSAGRRLLAESLAVEPVDVSHCLSDWNDEGSSAGVTPLLRLCVGINLFDSRGEPQGALFLFDSQAGTLEQEQKDFIISVARLAEQHLEGDIVRELRFRLESQKSQLDMLSEVVRQTDNGVIVTDTQGFITWINEGFEKITGYSLAEVIYKKPGHLLQGKRTDPKTVEYIRHRLARQKGFDAELINYYRDGTPYWVKVHCTPRLSEVGELEGFFAIQTNIDAEKKREEKLKRALKLNETILNTLYDAVITTDIRGRITTVNPSLETMFGYPKSALIGESITKLMPSDIAENHSGFMRAYATNDQPSAIMGNLRSIYGRKSDGTHFPLRIAVTETQIGSDRLLVAALHDISESEDAKVELQRFKDTLDKTADCVFMFDVDMLRFIYVNQGACDQLGYAASELLEMHPFDIEPHYNTPDKLRELVAPLLGGDVSNLRFQTFHRGADGHDIPVDITLQLIVCEGKEPRFVAIVRDITQQVRQQQQIEHLAYYDSLTNLPNRRSVHEKIDASMNACSKEGTFGAVLLMDLDDFKIVNDTWGHRAGDDLLCEVAAQLSQTLEVGDFVSRLGGDEFLIIIDHLSSDSDAALRRVNDVTDRIMASVAKPIEALSGLKHLSISVGVVLYRDARVSASELMRMADIAMYDAKKSGKNCMSVFDDEMQLNLLAEEKLIVELREALLGEKEIVPWLQPKVNENGHVTGFEALVRWQHPEHGVMTPGQFIALAEGNNLIVALGDQVLLKSCEFMSALRDEFSVNDLSIAVNVSQKQLAMPDFPDKVKAVLTKTGLPAHVLMLEITESVIAENIQESIERMERLGRIGVQFSLDDFGTGYSSLSYLRELPINEVKIDRSFVESLLMDEEGYAMVRSILHMANSLNLSVVAEGIERDEEWQTLKALGCKAFQGYLFSRPKSLQDTRDAIQQRGFNEV